MKMLLPVLWLIVVLGALAACGGGGPELTVVSVTAPTIEPVIQETAVVVGKMASTPGLAGERGPVVAGLATPAPVWEAAGTVVLAGTLRPVVESVLGPSGAGSEPMAVGPDVGSPAPTRSLRVLPASTMSSQVAGSVAVEDVLADSAAAMEQVGSAHYEASIVSTAMENGQSVDLVVTL